MKSNTTNGSGHLYGDSKYAHFSRITRDNQSNYPLFAKAKGERFVVHPGDSLYIPKGWWHWVESKGDRCVSISMWFHHDKPEVFDGVPRVFEGVAKDWPALEKWDNEYLECEIDPQTPEGIWIWMKNGRLTHKTSFADFVRIYSQNTEEFAYLITLSKYESSAKKHNSRIIDVLSKDFHPPVEGMRNVESNFWMNFGNVDTGLHFDDEDGLLTVVDGYKEVTLYPPDQTPYLYPYPLDIPKLQPYRQRMTYNIFKHMEGTVPEDCLTSADLLAKTLCNAPETLGKVAALQKHFGAGNIVWGVKNNKGEVEWELYFYGLSPDSTRYQRASELYSHNPDMRIDAFLEHHKKLFPADDYDADTIEQKNLCIFSIDLNEENSLQGCTPKLNLYYIHGNVIRYPILSTEVTFFQRSEGRKPFAKGVHINYDPRKTKVQELSRLLDIPEMLIIRVYQFVAGTGYDVRYMCITDKGEEIGVYMLGISVQNFIHFLVYNSYDIRLMEYVSSHAAELENIEKEIAFHFNKEALMGPPQQPVPPPTRSAFYGVL